MIGESHPERRCTADDDFGLANRRLNHEQGSNFPGLHNGGFQKAFIFVVSHGRNASLGNS